MSVIIKAKGASLLPPPSIPSQGASPTNSRVTQVAKRALDLNPQSDKERVVVRDPSHYEKIGPEITAEEGIAKKRTNECYPSISRRNGSRHNPFNF